MRVTQYIGARYVPLFYVNSDGTTEWREGVEYEALTIVTWNNNSYTSRKPVPVNVGSPSDNPEYWVQTGNYNAQIGIINNKVNYMYPIVEQAEKGFFSATPDQYYQESDGEDWAPAITRALADGAQIMLKDKQYDIYTDIELPTSAYISGSFRNSVLYFHNASFTVRGGRFNDGGTHKAYQTIENVRLIKDDAYPEKPIVDFQCVDYFLLNRCTFAGAGLQILVWEAFDCRLRDCWFSSGGRQAGDLPMCEFRSGNGGDPDLETLATVNNIYFYGCKWEGFVNDACRFTGTNNHFIFFTACKFETNVEAPIAGVVLNNTSHAYFDEMLFAKRLTNSKHYIQCLNNCSDVRIVNAACEYTGTGTYSGYPFIYLENGGQYYIDIRTVNAPESINYETFGMAFGVATIPNQVNVYLNNNGVNTRTPFRKITNYYNSAGVAPDAGTVYQMPDTFSGFFYITVSAASNDPAFIVAQCSNGMYITIERSGNTRTVTKTIPANPGDTLTIRGSGNLQTIEIGRMLLAGGLTHS